MGLRYNATLAQFCTSWGMRNQFSSDLGAMKMKGDLTCRTGSSKTFTKGYGKEVEANCVFAYYFGTCLSRLILCVCACFICFSFFFFLSFFVGFDTLA